MPRMVMFPARSIGKVADSPEAAVQPLRKDFHGTPVGGRGRQKYDASASIMSGMPESTKILQTGQ